MSVSLRSVIVFALVGSALGLAAGPAGAEEPFCYDCHDALAAVSTPHDPVAEGDCTACHQDHGDEEKLMLVEEGSALCYQCHDDMGGKPSVHPPVDDGECTGCHNPHGSDNAALLVAPAEEICFECHDAPEGAVVHAAVEDGCTTCHNPHSSDNGTLLTAPAEEICFECHDAPEGAVVHAAVEDGCTTCHNPHSSENGSLLTAPAGEICFECHEDSGFRDKVLHAAVEDGCSECHNPHSSENEKLLTANLTLERLARFEERQAELCFNCHDSEAFSNPQSHDTNFRHGDTNLHNLHLMGGAKPNKYGFTKPKDGQTCIACHLPHSALQERLVRTEFECKGIFCYTMRFKPSDSGGTCVVGCHKPRVYSRTATQESSTVSSSSSGPLSGRIP